MLSRKQALDLTKILSHYLTLGDSVNLIDVDFQELLAGLESYVLGDCDDLEHIVDDCSNCSVDNQYHDDHDDDSDNRTQDSEDEHEDEDYEDEDDYEEDDEVSISERSASLNAELKSAELTSISATDFHDLRGLLVTVVESPRLDEGEELELEFESDESEEKCDILLSGQPQGTLEIIRRDGCDIYLSETNEDESGHMEWHHLVTSRLPKQWSKLLPNGKFVVVGLS